MAKGVMERRLGNTALTYPTLFDLWCCQRGSVSLNVRLMAMLVGPKTL